MTLEQVRPSILLHEELPLLLISDIQNHLKTGPLSHVFRDITFAPSQEVHIPGTWANLHTNETLDAENLDTALIPQVSVKLSEGLVEFPLPNAYFSSLEYWHANRLDRTAGSEVLRHSKSTQGGAANFLFTSKQWIRLHLHSPTIPDHHAPTLPASLFSTLTNNSSSALAMEPRRKSGAFAQGVARRVAGDLPEQDRDDYWRKLYLAWWLLLNLRLNATDLSGIVDVAPTAQGWVSFPKHRKSFVDSLTKILRDQNCAQLALYVGQSLRELNDKLKLSKLATLCQRFEVAHGIFIARTFGRWRSGVLVRLSKPPHRQFQSVMLLDILGVWSVGLLLKHHDAGAVVVVGGDVRTLESEAALATISNQLGDAVNVVCHTVVDLFEPPFNPDGSVRAQTIDLLNNLIRRKLLGQERQPIKDSFSAISCWEESEPDVVFPLIVIVMRVSDFWQAVRNGALLEQQLVGLFFGILNGQWDELAQVEVDDDFVLGDNGDNFDGAFDASEVESAAQAKPTGKTSARIFSPKVKIILEFASSNVHPLKSRTFLSSCLNNIADSTGGILATIHPDRPHMGTSASKRNEMVKVVEEKVMKQVEQGRALAQQQAFYTRSQMFQRRVLASLLSFTCTSTSHSSLLEVQAGFRRVEFPIKGIARTSPVAWGAREPSELSITTQTSFLKSIVGQEQLHVVPLEAVTASEADGGRVLEFIQSCERNAIVVAVSLDRISRSTSGLQSILELCSAKSIRIIVLLWHLESFLQLRGSLSSCAPRDIAGWRTEFARTVLGLQFSWDPDVALAHLPELEFCASSSYTMPLCFPGDLVHLGIGNAAMRMELQFGEDFAKSGARRGREAARFERPVEQDILRLEMKTDVRNGLLTPRAQDAVGNVAQKFFPGASIEVLSSSNPIDCFCVHLPPGTPHASDCQVSVEAELQSDPDISTSDGVVVSGTEESRKREVEQAQEGDSEDADDGSAVPSGTTGTSYAPVTFPAAQTYVHPVQVAFEELDRDPSVKAIIVAGAGRAFCAGADLSPAGAKIAASRRVDRMNQHRDSGGQVTARIAKCRKLVVAAIHGPAVGVGITMTLPMDIRIVYKGAKIGFVFVRRGILPEAASSWFLPQLIGKSQTQALFMPGRVLTADHHLFNGLFFDLIDSPDKVLPAAIELVKEIVQNASLVSIAITKAMVWHDQGSPEGQHLLDSKGILYTGNGADSREGTSSFLEKRIPEFPGRIDGPSGTYGLPSYYPWWNSQDISSPDWPTDRASQLALLAQFRKIEAENSKL
ncbi:hypothetical protein HDU93_005164 [Gonapodya sp. JEL0774]|nr:hypothetical protein HDU93_005164 [Gonapodya sp. JEL0774]